METQGKQVQKFKQTKFKSYYVVWKPPSIIEGCIRGCEFKSYYVVWKLAYTSSPVIADDMFKSYYVVWKPSSLTSLNFLFIPCLNRTM